MPRKTRIGFGGQGAVCDILFMIVGSSLGSATDQHYDPEQMIYLLDFFTIKMEIIIPTLLGGSYGNPIECASSCKVLKEKTLMVKSTELGIRLAELKSWLCIC